MKKEEEEEKDDEALIRDVSTAIGKFLEDVSGSEFGI